MNNNKNRAALSGRLLRPLALLLIISLTAALLSSCIVFGKYKTESRDVIIARMKDMEDEYPDHEFIGDYLTDFGIGNFNYYKLAIAQACFDEYYYEDLPSVRDMAWRIAELFLQHYYDSIDLDSTEATTDALLRCYTLATGDPYAFYRNAEEYLEYQRELSGESEFVGIGVRISANDKTGTVTVTCVFPSSGAEEAGVIEDDLIIGARDKTVAKDGIDAVLNAIRGKEGERIAVKFLRDGTEFTSVITLKKYSDQSVFFSMQESSIGYIRVVDFNEKTTADFKSAVDTLMAEGAVGLVFDMSSNPGGLVDTAVALIDYIVPDKDKNGAPVLITRYSIAESQTKHYAKDGHSIDLPIIVLCNKYTASAGELFTSSMRDYDDMGLVDATVMGQTTFGKGILQSSIALYSTYNEPDGSYLTFTMAYYYPPLGVNYHDVGIVPDIILDKKADRIGAAIDEILSPTADKAPPPGSTGTDALAA